MYVPSFHPEQSHTTPPSTNPFVSFFLGFSLNLFPSLFYLDFNFFLSPFFCNKRWLDNCPSNNAHWFESIKHAGTNGFAFSSATISSGVFTMCESMTGLPSVLIDSAVS